MDRSNFYSQTEACKTFKITSKRFKELIKNLNVLTNPITLRTTAEGKAFNVNAIYVLKSDFDAVV